MAQTQTFLFEIGTEEMPSAPLTHAVSQLKDLINKGLKDAGLSHGDIRIISSPRRLAALVQDVATATQEIHEVRRGPAANIAFGDDGQPTKAAQGFARKFGLTADQLVKKVDDDGREYVFAEQHIEAQAAQPLLAALCEQTIANIEWPNYRSQRWGSAHQSFVRPIRWLCTLFGSEVLPVHYADVDSSNTTRGHRVLAPGDHEVSSADAYIDVLHENFVLDAPERAERIRAQIREVEQTRGGAHVDTPKRTFDEVVNLCEWPSVVVGAFDEEFLEVPHEIICESMLTNQRYFPIYDAQGNLTREFVVVSNANPACAETVIDGNERVVRARLDDAKFFYEEDLKISLDSFVERLSNVVFQEKLGTVRQKVTRMEAIAAQEAKLCGLSITDSEDAIRAAHLAKADLVSQAVVEFTSQQGVMGGYYARAQHEHDQVALAISEHYRPRFAGDELPENTCGKLVAIADKIDTICGMFAIDEPPTGSSDPFALRRSAIGVIAIMRSLPELTLQPMIQSALDAYAEQGLNFDAEVVLKNVEAFFAGRLASIAKDEGIEADTIESIAHVGIVDPVEFLSRCHALDTARSSDADTFEDLAIAFARADHLSDTTLGTDVNTEILTEPEMLLLNACTNGATKVHKSLSNGDFNSALSALADLRAPIDRFFDDVMVMDEDTVVRENRLRLLNLFTSVFADVADFGVLSKA